MQGAREIFPLCFRRRRARGTPFLSETYNSNFSSLSSASVTAMMNVKNFNKLQHLWRMKWLLCLRYKVRRSSAHILLNIEMLTHSSG